MMKLPGAIYRIQFCPSFIFSDAERIVLYDLGTTDFSASPVHRSREGSIHGYDMTDPDDLRAVDYGRRISYLREIMKREGTAPMFTAAGLQANAFTHVVFEPFHSVYNMESMNSSHSHSRRRGTQC